jgi:chromosomal replication initiator protein
VPAPDATPTAGASLADADFASFLEEVAREVEAHVEPWRMRVGEAVSQWQREGIVTTVLERALALPAEPDVDGLLGTFGAAVARLRALEGEVRALDPALAQHDAFRDPARVAEARSLVSRALRERGEAARGRNATRAAPSALAAQFELDPETFVLEWPDVGALLVEEYR